MDNVRHSSGILLAFALVLACLAAGPAAAQSRSFLFDIQEQSLSQALQSYGRISGQQIVFTEDLVAGRDSPPLQGEFDADAALERLLCGSGLVAERSPSGVLMIRRESAQPRPATPARKGAAGPSSLRDTGADEDFGRTGVYLYTGHPIGGAVASEPRGGKRHAESFTAHDGHPAQRRAGHRGGC